MSARERLTLASELLTRVGAPHQMAVRRRLGVRRSLSAGWIAIPPIQRTSIRIATPLLRSDAAGIDSGATTHGPTSALLAGPIDS